MGKVFVGGLSRDTTTSGLRVYFERFGHISDCVVMKDRSTGAPRGFGFVTYRNQTIADHVVAQRHLIDGKEVEAKPAVPRDSETLNRPGHPGNGATSPTTTVPPASPSPSNTTSTAGELKIFVGGLSHETSETEFVSYFETFGKVTDCVIMCDPHTRKPRGFGFITYDNTASVDRVCGNKFHDLNGKRVEVKRAIPQERMLAAADEGGVPAGGRFPGGRGIVGAGPQFGANGLPLNPWTHTGLPAIVMNGSPPRMQPLEQPSCALDDTALSTAHSVLDSGGNETGIFHIPGGNFSSATRSLNQGIRTTYGQSSPFAPELSQQGQQQQQLLLLQEEQLKLQIAQQAFSVQQAKHLQEMQQQIVAAQHAIVAQHGRMLEGMPPSAINQYAPSAQGDRALQNLYDKQQQLQQLQMQHQILHDHQSMLAGGQHVSMMPTFGPLPTFGLVGTGEHLEAQLAQMSCSSNHA